MGIDEYQLRDSEAATKVAAEVVLTRVPDPKSTPAPEEQAAMTTAVEKATESSPELAAATYFSVVLATENHLLFCADTQPIEGNALLLLTNIARFAKGQDPVADSWDSKKNGLNLTQAGLTELFRSMLMSNLNAAADRGQKLLPILIGADTLTALGVNQSSSGQTLDFDSLVASCDLLDDNLPVCAIAPSLGDMLAKPYRKADFWRCLRYRA